MESRPTFLSSTSPAYPRGLQKFGTQREEWRCTKPRQQVQFNLIQSYQKRLLVSFQQSPERPTESKKKGGWGKEQNQEKNSAVSKTTNTLITFAFVPTVTPQRDKLFKRTALSQLLAILRKQGKLILSRTEVSSEGIYIGIFHLDQKCLFEDHLPVVSNLSAAAHTGEWFWGPQTRLLDKPKHGHTLWQRPSSECSW